jgi:hypothetical protein
LAAATSASIPPKAEAEVAVAALTPPLVLEVVVLLGGAHAAVTSIAPTAMPIPIPRTDFFTRRASSKPYPSG